MSITVQASLGVEIVAPSPRVVGGIVRWLRVAVTRHWLDRRLAEGFDPASSGALAARARQLTSRRVRERTARVIDELARDTARPPRCSAAVTPVRSSLWLAHSQLRHIAQILRDPAPVYARGVALSRALVYDGSSPLYAPADAVSAFYWAETAIDALEGRI